VKIRESEVLNKLVNKINSTIEDMDANEHPVFETIGDLVFYFDNMPPEVSYVFKRALELSEFAEKNNKPIYVLTCNTLGYAYVVGLESEIKIRLENFLKNLTKK